MHLNFNASTEASYLLRHSAISRGVNGIFLQRERLDWDSAPAYCQKPYWGWRCGGLEVVTPEKFFKIASKFLDFGALQSGLCLLQQSVKSTTLCRPMEKIKKHILCKCCRNNMINSQNKASHEWQVFLHKFYTAYWPRADGGGGRPPWYEKVGAKHGAAIEVSPCGRSLGFSYHIGGTIACKANQRFPQPVVCEAVLLQATQECRDNGCAVRCLKFNKIQKDSSRYVGQYHLHANSLLNAVLFDLEVDLSITTDSFDSESRTLASFSYCQRECSREKLEHHI